MTPFVTFQIVQIEIKRAFLPLFLLLPVQFASFILLLGSGLHGYGAPLFHAPVAV